LTTKRRRFSYNKGGDGRRRRVWQIWQARRSKC
jgi:hypothetical protein